MSEHKSGAVSREYHIAVIEKKDRELSTLKAQHDELLAAAKRLSSERTMGLASLEAWNILRAAIANAERPPCD